MRRLITVALGCLALAGGLGQLKPARAAGAGLSREHRVRVRPSREHPAHSAQPGTRRLRAQPDRLPPVLLGAFASYGNMSQRQSFDTLETRLGVNLRIDSHYYNWTDPFPGPAEQRDVADGQVPMDTWWGTNYQAINDGSQDALIIARAEAIKAFGSPVFLRWAAEMNGDWYPWSGPQNGDDPAAFIAAWRHIHEIFTAVGATNAIWVWAPNADSHPGGTDPGSWNNWSRYYPGDGYVDWVGIDGYNWGERDGNRWQSFGAIFSPVYDTYAGRKPIMIAETGSVAQGGNKARWLLGARRWVRKHADVRALVYFDTNQSSSGIDWRIDSSSSSLAAFRAIATDPWFGGSAFSSPAVVPTAAQLRRATRR